MGRSPRIDWSDIDWQQSAEEIAAQLSCALTTARMGKRVHDLLTTSRTWESVIPELGTVTDGDLAEKYGIPVMYINVARRILAIPPHKSEQKKRVKLANPKPKREPEPEPEPEPEREPIPFPSWSAVPLGRIPDADIARILNVPEAYVAWERKRRGLEEPEIPEPDTEDEEEETLPPYSKDADAREKDGIKITEDAREWVEGPDSVQEHAAVDICCIASNERRPGLSPAFESSTDFTTREEIFYSPDVETRLGLAPVPSLEHQFNKYEETDDDSRVRITYGNVGNTHKQQAMQAYFRRLRRDITLRKLAIAVLIHHGQDVPYIRERLANLGWQVSRGHCYKEISEVKEELGLPKGGRIKAIGLTDEPKDQPETEPEVFDADDEVPEPEVPDEIDRDPAEVRMLIYPILIEEGMMSVHALHRIVGSTPDTITLILMEMEDEGIVMSFNDHKLWMASPD